MMKNKSKVWVLRDRAQVQAGGLILVLLLPSGAHAQDPVEANAEEDIRPPRELIIVPEEPAPILSPNQSGALGAGMLAAAILWLALAKRRKMESALPPLEVAREALRRIDSERETLPAGDLAEKTAGVVRSFTADTFGIAAPQRTTEEFLHSLATDPQSPLRPLLAQLQDFLQSCDKAKFAGAALDSLERFALLQTAGHIIQSAARLAAPAPPPA